MIRRPKNGPSGNAGDIASLASAHLIDLRSVVKDYVTDAGPFRALDGVDLQVDAGEFISVVGRSGCGKSTLMNMITGIDRATAGVVVRCRPGPGPPVRGPDRRLARPDGRRHLPVLPAAADADRGRERDAADGLRRAVDAARTLRAGHEPARARGHGRSGTEAAVEHVRRAAAARRGRARPGQRPAPARRRRADGQPRLGDGGCRLRALRGLRGAGPDDRDRDPRRGAGEANAPRRAHGGWPHPGRLARRGCRRGRRRRRAREPASTPLATAAATDVASIEASEAAGA